MPNVKPLLFFIVLSLFTLSTAQSQTRKDLDKLTQETNVSELPYDTAELVVRGFDGANPPPRVETPTRQLLYGYGMTAYIIDFDSIIYFDIIRIDAVHRAKNGEEIKRFEIIGSRYPKSFKAYFLEQLNESERAHIIFENIYLRDKSGNYLKLESEQRFCPHCVP